MRRSGNLILVLLPMFFVCGIALGALDGLGTTFTLIYWVVAVIVSIVTFGVWLHSRIVLARDLSQWFDRKISWFQLPRLRPTSFDAWRARMRLLGPSERPEPEPVGEAGVSDPEPEPVGDAGVSDPEPVGESSVGTA